MRETETKSVNSIHAAKTPCQLYQGSRLPHQKRGWLQIVGIAEVQSRQQNVQYCTVSGRLRCCRLLRLPRPPAPLVLNGLSPEHLKANVARHGLIGACMMVNPEERWGKRKGFGGDVGGNNPMTLRIWKDGWFFLMYKLASLRQKWKHLPFVEILRARYMYCSYNPFPRGFEK